VKRIRLDKTFESLHHDDEDEFYQNGIFAFNITKLLSYLNESTIQTANLSSPLILAEIAPTRFNVIDGNHRLEKAFCEGVDKISVYRVLVEKHLPFLTTKQSYRAYIEYWNSKIDEMET
jgi:hypothetical protein